MPDPAGLQIKEIAAAIRRYKSDKGLALNSQLPGISVYSDLCLETTDLQGVANSPVESKMGKPDIEMKATDIKPVIKVLGPLFKDRSSQVIKALGNMDPAEVALMKSSGSIRVELESDTVDVPAQAVDVVTQTLQSGQAVDMLTVGNSTVLIKR
jgi:valyl-tRNA synthetase